MSECLHYREIDRNASFFRLNSLPFSLQQELLLRSYLFDEAFLLIVGLFHGMTVDFALVEGVCLRVESIFILVFLLSSRGGLYLQHQALI